MAPRHPLIPTSPPAGLGAPLSVPVRDLSRGGLRFLLPRRLPLDTQFVALLPSGAGWPTSPGPEAAMSPVADVPSAPQVAGETSPEQTMAVLCGVAYWQPLAKDLFAIGGQFIEPIPNFAAPGVAPRVVLPGEIEGETPPALGPSHDAPPLRRVAS